MIQVCQAWVSKASRDILSSIGPCTEYRTEKSLNEVCVGLSRSKNSIGLFGIFTLTLVRL